MGFTHLAQAAKAPAPGISTSPESSASPALDTTITPKGGKSVFAIEHLEITEAERRQDNKNSRDLYTAMKGGTGIGTYTDTVLDVIGKISEYPQERRDRFFKEYERVYKEPLLKHLQEELTEVDYDTARILLDENYIIERLDSIDIAGADRLLGNRSEDKLKEIAEAYQDKNKVTLISRLEQMPNHINTGGMGGLLDYSETKKQLIASVVAAKPKPIAEEIHFEGIEKVDSISKIDDDLAKAVKQQIDGSAHLSERGKLALGAASLVTHLSALSGNELTAVSRNPQLKATVQSAIEKPEIAVISGKKVTSDISPRDATQIAKALRDGDLLVAHKLLADKTPSEIADIATKFQQQNWKSLTEHIQNMPKNVKNENGNFIDLTKEQTELVDKLKNIEIPGSSTVGVALRAPSADARSNADANQNAAEEAALSISRQNIDEQLNFDGIKNEGLRNISVRFAHAYANLDQDEMQTLKADVANMLPQHQREFLKIINRGNADTSVNYLGQILRPEERSYMRELHSGLARLFEDPQTFEVEKYTTKSKGISSAEYAAYFAKLKLDLARNRPAMLKDEPEVTDEK